MDSMRKSSNNPHLFNAKQFSEKREPKLALDELDQISDPQKLPLNDKCDFFILKSNCFCKINQYSPALELGEKALEYANQSGQTKFKVEALVAKGTAEFRLGNNAECLKVLEQIHDLLRNDSQCSEKEIDLLYERYYLLSSFYYYQTLQKEKFLESNQKRLEICEKYEMFYETGEVYHNLGISYLMMGELLTSIKYYQRSLDIGKKTKNHNQIAYCLGNIGKIYAVLGELDLALDFYEQSLVILREIKNDYVLGAFSIALGEIYMEKGDLQRSMNYFQEGYAIVKKLGNNLNIGGALFKIIENYLLQNDISSAENIFATLEKIGQQDNNRRIEFTYKFAQALILKKKGGSRNIVRAGDIIRDLLSIEDLKNDPLLHLKYCELLFEEMAKTNEENILDELNPLLEKIDQIANLSQSIELRCEIKLLRAKFDLISLSFDHAENNFISGQKIARKFSLKRLEQKISQEYDNFLQYADKWNEMKHLKTNLSERLKFSSIADILQMLMKTKPIENLDSTTEISKLLGIVSDSNESTIRLYSTDHKGMKINLDISSIKNKFKSTAVDRIRYENNTIIMNQIGSETLYYVLEGNTYQAQQNLQKFSDEIVLSQKMLESKGLPFSIGEVIEIVKNSENISISNNRNSPTTLKLNGDIHILQKNDLITAPYRFNILYCLFNEGRMNWSELKNKLNMTSGNLGYHLETLEKKGWIIKDEEIQERFLQFIDISDYGKAEFRKFLDKINQMCQKALD